jgi:hypothetical protein
MQPTPSRGDQSRTPSSTTAEDCPCRRPFDRLGVLALIWAALFAVAAIGLAMAIG